MFYTADLHIHSHYAGGTSPSLCLERLYQWAQIKGIHILGTGDFTHPRWFTELQEKLVNDDSGFYTLINIPLSTELPGIHPKQIPVKFCLSTEVCCEYVYKNKLHKPHHLIYAPDFESVLKINKKLSQYADLSKDGRPTLPVSSRNLLEIILGVSEKAYLVPAHAWTPWHSVFGSEYGYDNLEECFRDLTPHIFALETGLSSDPDMNRRWSKLDHLTMLSSSDAHSLKNLGREVNCLDTEMNYDAMFNAIKTGIGFIGTYEYFSLSGKYSFDGHRECKICMSPQETSKHKGICPVCNKKLVIGAYNRVETLADRELTQQPSQSYKTLYTIPLPNLISELETVSAGTKKVTAAFIKAINFSGNEFSLLHEMPLESIHAFRPRLAEAVKRMRAGAVKLTAGYHGVYGSSKVFDENYNAVSQTSLF